MDRFLAEPIERRARVVATGAAEQGRALVAVLAEVQREAEARLDLVLLGFALMPGADVVLQAQVVEDRDLRRGRHVVVIERIGLVIPAHTQIELQALGDIPVILDVRAQLIVVQLGAGAEWRIYGAVRAGEAAGIGRPDLIVVRRHGVVVLQQVDAVTGIFDAHLHGVVAVPGQAGKGQIIAQGGLILGLVLQTDSAAKYRDVRLVDLLDQVGFGSGGIEFVATAVEQQVVGPVVAVRTPFQQQVADIVVAFGAPLIGRCAAEAQYFLVLAVGVAEIDGVVLVGLPAQLAKPGFLVERRGKGAVVLREARIDDRHAVVVDVLALFVVDEEQQFVLEDRTAKVEAALLALVVGLLHVILLVEGILRDHRLVLEIVIDRTVELVAARLGDGRDDGGAGLLVLSLVVLRQHAIFGDRFLRERIAATGVLSDQAALENVVALAGTIDENVYILG